MTSMPHLALMEWDYADRLKHTLKSAGSAQDTYFTYDAAGQRVRKVYVHNGLIEERIYLGGYEVYRRHTAGAITTTPEQERQTLHVMDDQRRVAMLETETRAAGAPVGSPVTRWRFQLDNHLGSACLELDAAGSVISYEEYHPYGGTAFQTARGGAEVSAKRYRYTGKEKDEETGLYYHGARYYAPWLGRWTAADPAGIRGGINLQEYAASNPVRLVDPQGHEPLDPNNRNVQRLRAKGLSDAQIQDLIQNPPGLRRGKAHGGAGGQGKRAGGGAKQAGGGDSSRTGGGSGAAGGSTTAPPDAPPAQPPQSPAGTGTGSGKGGGGATSTAEDIGRALSQAAGVLNLQSPEGTEGGSKYGSPLGHNDEAEANVISQIGTAIVGIAVGIYSLVSSAKAVKGAYTAVKAAFAEAFSAGAGAFRSLGGKIAYGLGRLLGNIKPSGPVPKIEPPPPELSDSRRKLLEQLRLRERQLELGSDAARGGAYNAAQGAGGVRIEQALGRRITPGTHQGVDFVDDVLGPISLKGPIPQAGSAEGLAASATKDLSYNTATKTLFVDLTGLSAQQAAQVQSAILKAAASSPKRVYFLGLQ